MHKQVAEALKVTYDFCAAAFQEAIMKGDRNAAKEFRNEMRRLDAELKLCGAETV
jgi:hypothetical protein